MMWYIYKTTTSLIIYPEILTVKEEPAGHGLPLLRWLATFRFTLSIVTIRLYNTCMSVVILLISERWNGYPAWTDNQNQNDSSCSLPEMDYLWLSMTI